MEPARSLSMDSFLECCGSTSFASQMAERLPFTSLEHVKTTARLIWWNQVNVPGWLEAFAAHPRIGDIWALETKFSQDKEWAAGEQSSALASASRKELQELADWNNKYEMKFGHIFLICASGKSCLEVLTALKVRFCNQPIDELWLAAAEQQKITELRLSKLQCWPSKPSDKDMHRRKKEAYDNERVGCQSAVSASSPPITTHVLDVSLGRPGIGINVMLEIWNNSTELNSYIREGSWSTIGSSVTNSDGRSGPLMDNSNVVKAGRYRLTFHTEEYFQRTQNLAKTSEGSCGFYPHVLIVFEVKPSQMLEHFHVPLLLSPYSYTTYRGS